jgi:cupin fold WbuC family metalloprotein
VTQRVVLGPVGSGRTMLYRLNSSRWHTVVSLTDFAVIHETTSGPFQPGDAEYAPWAPDGTDRLLVEDFLRSLGCPSR